MKQRPKLRLSRLRDIGWSLWDPIGLNDFDGKWEEVTFADEYDGYLIHVASLLRDNTPVAEAVEYLILVETERMGLSAVPGMHDRAHAVVKAIKDDKQLWSRPSS